MDPDIPLPSIEQSAQSSASSTVSAGNLTNFRDTADTPASSSPPTRTLFKTPRSHPATPATTKSTRSPSRGRNERHVSPHLLSKRSSSSLSTSRGQTPSLEQSRVQLQRVSSNLNPSAANPSKAAEMPQPPPSPTPSSVAQEFFQRELEAHASNKSIKTVVLLHDSCYGHRFSRPRTSKTALATIVERPERIHATILGASTAYVRLGERHAEGAYGPHPDRMINSLSTPPFILKKTARATPLDHPAVTHVHGSKWMEELQIMCDSAESKLAMNGKELQRPIGYGKDESGNTLPKLHEGDLYLCAESLAALQGCLGGVYDAVDAVFTTESKRAFVCIRPPGHHCSSNYPSGFCWLNNVHVGISYAAMDHGLTHAAIIDFDLHHGDGSQTITWDHNRKAQTLAKNAAQHKKTPIGYYSLHDINSYPCEWGDEDKVRNASLCIENAHGQSIWNVHLEPWRSLEHFWQLYESRYKILLDKTRLFLQHHSQRLRSARVQPKAAIFLSAGFDASQWEGQGMQRHNVNVPTEFYARFTADIVRLASEPGLGVEGRVISVLEGGYSDRALTSGVLSHLCGLAESTESRADPKKLAASSHHSQSHATNGSDTSLSPDPTWWSDQNLAALEDRVAGNVTAEPKKNIKAPGNYSSPTHASTARMAEVARERTSLSTQLENRLYIESLAPDPPPPVDWITASYELSRILIPSDRQTLSCRHDELNAEATKVRRERQSAVGVAPAAEPRMQLRTRTKATGEDGGVRAATRTSNRRTTIAAVSELPDPSMVETSRARRRSSAASSILSSFQDLKLDEQNSMSQAGKLPQNVVTNSTKETTVKKTKAAPSTRKTATKTSSPRKARENGSRTSTGASTQNKASHARASNGAASVRPGSRSRPTSTEAVAHQDAMDDLTNGLKKVSIKLKMPTYEQHEENQRKSEETKTAKTKMTRKPPVPKNTNIPSAGSANVGQPPKSKPLQSDMTAQETNSVPAPSSVHMSSFQHTDGSDAHSVPVETHGVEMTPKVNAIATASSPPNDQTHQMVDEAMPSSFPINTVHGQTERRADLPTFTSTSNIPFANTSSMTYGVDDGSRPEENNGRQGV